MLQAIAGILGTHHHESVANGHIRLGTEVFSPLPRKVMFPTVGLTLQDPRFQISGLRESVLEEIALTLQSFDYPEAEVDARTDQMIERIGLSHLSHRRPSSLSGGELQRVALANVLIAQPEILLLDEPCNSLDGVAQSRLGSLIRSIKGTTTVILADYQIDFALPLADHFVVLNEGTVVFAGDRAGLINRFSEFRNLLPTEHWEEVRRSLAASSKGTRIMKKCGVT